MGMFDKDKEVGTLLTSAFQQGQQFILWNAVIDREDYPTQYGPVPRAVLTVSQIEGNRAGRRFEVNAVASAIVAKVRDAEPSDFPAVVMWREAPSQRSSSGKATVLQFISAWGNAAPEDRPEEVKGDGFTPRLTGEEDRTGGREFPPAVPAQADDVPPF